MRLISAGDKGVTGRIACARYAVVNPPSLIRPRFPNIIYFGVSTRHSRATPIRREKTGVVISDIIIATGEYSYLMRMLWHLLDSQLMRLFTTSRPSRMIGPGTPQKSILYGFPCAAKEFMRVRGLGRGIYILPTGQLKSLTDLISNAVYSFRFFMIPFSRHLQYVREAGLYHFFRIWGWNGRRRELDDMFHYYHYTHIVHNTAFYY